MISTTTKVTSSVFCYNQNLLRKNKINASKYIDMNSSQLSLLESIEKSLGLYFSGLSLILEFFLDSALLCSSSGNWGSFLAEDGLESRSSFGAFILDIEGTFLGDKLWLLLKWSNSSSYSS